MLRVLGEGRQHAASVESEVFSGVCPSKGCRCRPGASESVPRFWVGRVEIDRELELFGGACGLSSEFMSRTTFERPAALVELLGDSSGGNGRRGVAAIRRSESGGGKGNEPQRAADPQISR